jgi:hypothetical protein
LTLEERLRELPEDLTVSIGATTAFIWIGAAKDAIAAMKAATVEYHQRNVRALKASIEAYLGHINTLNTKRVKLHKAYANFLGGAMIDGVLAASEEYKVCQTNMSETRRLMKDREKRAMNFTPFLWREVVEEYEKTAVDAGLCISIEGEEEGDFWFKGDDTKVKVREE